MREGGKEGREGGEEGGKEGLSVGGSRRAIKMEDEREGREKRGSGEKEKRFAPSAGSSHSHMQQLPADLDPGPRHKARQLLLLATS